MVCFSCPLLCLGMAGEDFVWMPFGHLFSLFLWPASSDQDLGQERKGRASWFLDSNVPLYSSCCWLLWLYGFCVAKILVLNSSWCTHITDTSTRHTGASKLLNPPCGNLAQAKPHSTPFLVSVPTINHSSHGPHHLAGDPLGMHQQAGSSPALPSRTSQMNHSKLTHNSYARWKDWKFFLCFPYSCPASNLYPVLFCPQQCLSDPQQVCCTNTHPTGGRNFNFLFLLALRIFARASLGMDTWLFQCTWEQVLGLSDIWLVL